MLVNVALAMLQLQRTGEALDALTTATDQLRGEPMRAASFAAAAVTRARALLDLHRCVPPRIEKHSLNIHWQIC